SAPEQQDFVGNLVPQHAKLFDLACKALRNVSFQPADRASHRSERPLPCLVKGKVGHRLVAVDGERLEAPLEPLDTFHQQREIDKHLGLGGPTLAFLHSITPVIAGWLSCRPVGYVQTQEPSLRTADAAAVVRGAR